jgi:hypothetical protein
MTVSTAIGEDDFMDRDWLAEWRVSVTAQVGQLLETFQSRFGFEPGLNQLGPPAADQALASLQAIVPRPAADLIDFYRRIGQVSLPDVGNGYFIHPADLVARQATAAEPGRIGPPHELDVLVFGSDGGGALYAVPAAKPGPVYRLRECSVKDGIALAADIQIIAADYRTFLRRLEIAVETFAATGHLADL